MDEEKAPGKGQVDVRLTIRAPDNLETKIRQETTKRGTNMNQTMLYMIYRVIDSV